MVYLFVIQLVTYKKSVLNCYTKRGNVNTLLFFSMGLLLLLNCLRSLETGNDTISYYSLFEHYKGTSNDYSVAALLWMDSYIDIGYRMINKLFLKLSDNYQLFISTIAVFMYCAVNRYIKKYSCNAVYSVFLFFLLFFHVYLNMLRQALAISIILLGIHYLFENKKIRFIVIVLIATLFHKTAIIALLLLPIAYKKHFSISKSIVTIGLAIVLTFSGGISKILEIIGYSGKYITEENGISTYAGIVLSSIVLLCMLFVSRKNINRENLLDGGDNIYARFYIRIPVIQVIISIASLALPILYRCEYYFTIFYLAGIPYFLMNSDDSKSNRRVIGTFILIVYSVYMAGILLLRPEWYSEFQYHFFWMYKR